MKRRRQSKLERQITTLRTRLAFVERALKRASKNPTSLRTIARIRDAAEQQAKRKALAEYYEQRKIERYLRNPTSLTIDLELENERNEFLASRGFAPEPSDIPEQFRRGLKKYRPTPTRRST